MPAYESIMLPCRMRARSGRDVFRTRIIFLITSCGLIAEQASTGSTPPRSSLSSKV